MLHVSSTLWKGGGEQNEDTNLGPPVLGKELASTLPSDLHGFNDILKHFDKNLNSHNHTKPCVYSQGRKFKDFIGRDARWETEI